MASTRTTSETLIYPCDSNICYKTHKCHRIAAPKNRCKINTIRRAANYNNHICKLDGLMILIERKKMISPMLFRRQQHKFSNIRQHCPHYNCRVLLKLLASCSMSLFMLITICGCLFAISADANIPLSATTSSDELLGHTISSAPHNSRASQNNQKFRIATHHHQNRRHPNDEHHHKRHQSNQHPHNTRYEQIVTDPPEHSTFQHRKRSHHASETSAHRDPDYSGDIVPVQVEVQHHNDNERDFNDLSSQHSRHYEHHQYHTAGQEGAENNDIGGGSSKWSRLRNLKSTFNLHRYFHRKRKEDRKQNLEVETNRIGSPVDVGEDRASRIDAGIKTHDDSDSEGVEPKHDLDMADEDDDGNEVTNENFSPSIAEENSAASQHEVPERLPIVVSYSDNSYVSASPISSNVGVVGSVVSKVGRLRIQSTTPITSTEFYTYNPVGQSDRQSSELESVTLATTTSTTEATTTTPTTATTTGLLYPPKNMAEESMTSKSKSPSNLDRFSKQAQMWSDFSDGLDFDEDDDNEPRKNDNVDTGDIDTSATLDPVDVETTNIESGLNDDGSTRKEVIGETVKFDINEQYLDRPSTIIKTTESIEKGATFIKYTIVTNMNACLVECWITESCDTAVYQESPVEFNSSYNINSSPHTTSAQSTHHATSLATMTEQRAPGSSILSEQHNSIHKQTSPSFDSIESSIFYKSDNYAIGSDNDNNVNTNRLPINDSRGSGAVDDQVVSEHEIIGDDDKNRPIIFVDSANNNADNDAKHTSKTIKHNGRWFKDTSDNTHANSLDSSPRRQLKNLDEHGFYICYLFECAKKDGFKCEFSPHSFYTSSTKQQVISNTQYSSIIRSPTNSLPLDSPHDYSQLKWSRIHRASIDIGEEDISKLEQGGLNSAIIAIMFGVGATGMLIFIVGHKMKSIRRRVAYEGRRRSIVPDKDFLINSLAD